MGETDTENPGTRDGEDGADVEREAGASVSPPEDGGSGAEHPAEEHAHSHSHDSGHGHSHQHHHHGHHDHGQSKPGHHDDGGEGDTGAEEKLGTRAEIESVGSLKRRIKAAVPAEKVRQELDKNYKELATTVQIRGFRPGRVPRRLLEARFGDEITSDVKEALLGLSFAEVIEEHGFKVVGSPTFDNVRFDPAADLTYEVEIELKPEFELPQYKGLEVTAEPFAEKPEEIEERLQALQKRLAEHEKIALTEASPEDLHEGKYNLYRDGVKVKSGVAARFRPSSKVLESFYIERLPELCATWDRASEKPLEVDVTVPSSYPDQVLRGAQVHLEFTLEAALRERLPPIDDDFAKKLGEESLESLRKQIEEGQRESRKRESEKSIEAKVLAQVVDATQLELPEGLLEAIRRRSRHELEHELLQQGLPPDKVQEMLVKSEKGREENEAPDDARRSMKEYFVLEKIADAEKIFVTEEDIQRRVQALSTLYRVPLPRLLDDLRSSGKLEELRFSIRSEKVKAFLRKKAKVVEAAAEGT